MVRRKKVKTTTKELLLAILVSIVIGVIVLVSIIQTFQLFGVEISVIGVIALVITLGVLRNILIGKARLSLNYNIKR